METFEKYLEKMGYSWNDFDRPYEMNNIIEQFADAGRRKLLFAFEDYWTKNNCDGEKFDEVVDRFLSNNSY